MGPEDFRKRYFTEVRHLNNTLGRIILKSDNNKCEKLREVEIAFYM